MHCVYYPPEVGGLESHVANLARGLVARGHEVRVVTSRSQPGLARDEVIEGVRVRRTWLPGRTPMGWAAHALGSVPVTRRWAGWAQVAHAQAFQSVLPVGLAAGGRERPWVATFHTSHFLVRARRPLWRPVLRTLVRWPDHALAASREIAEVAMELAPGREVEPLANGVETGTFRPVEPALSPEPSASGGGDGPVRRIVVPRRLFTKNGVEHLVRAMPRIRDEVPGTTALVVGDGPERVRLEALTMELGLERAVRFLGARGHDEMPALLCSGELAVFPSLKEATSVAALEAMACGLPVVASRVGGLPEIVDDDVGTLVAPGDPEALARGVAGLLLRSDLAEMGRRARERVVSRFSNARLVVRLLAIYEALAAGEPVEAPRTEECG
jgi:glycosyltransferase involved in cell wall biosynthesis